MHTYMYHVIHASRLNLIIIINIIINVKNKLLRSIIVTAKSSKKMKGDK